MRVSSRGKDVGVLNDIRAWTRLDKLTAQRTHERIHLVVRLQLL